MLSLLLFHFSHEIFFLIYSPNLPLLYWRSK